MQFEKVLEFKGRVTDVLQENIPEILMGVIESSDARYVVKMDLHKEVFTLSAGDEVLFQVTRGVPEYRDGVDFVGRATVVTVRENNMDPSVDKKWIHILSIGGLLVAIYSDEPLPLKPVEKVYVRVSPLGK